VTAWCSLSVLGGRIVFALRGAVAGVASPAAGAPLRQTGEKVLMRKVASIELRSDGDHLYARPLFHSGWTQLVGTSRPRGGWYTLPLDPPSSLLRSELEQLLRDVTREIGAAWDYEQHNPDSRIASDEEPEPGQGDDQP
jgi:hypothetical protein